MEASEKLISKIKEFEGLRLSAYVCEGGKLTIGYGHTENVKAGQKITCEEALVLLKKDIIKFENYVNDLGVVKTQGQFDALTDFAFNLGCGKLASSTLLKKIRQGASLTVIQAEFKKWVYAGGKIQGGLQRRREWEAARYAEES